MKSSFLDGAYRRLLPVFLLSIPGLCIAQADVDIGGSEEDDGYYNSSYDGQGGYYDGMPIVYAGDGMRVIIDTVDDTGVRASGTIVLGKQPPMPFEIQMQLGENGEMSEGEVMTPSGPKAFRAWNQDEEVTIAELEGRRYRLVYQETFDSNAGGSSPPPAPVQSGGNLNKSVAPGNNTRPAPPPLPVGAGKSTVELVAHKLGSTHTLLAPKGWKVEGGAWSPPAEAFSWMPSRFITVTAPDGSSVRFKPNVSAIYQRIMMEQPPQPGSLHQASGLLNLPLPGSASEWGQWIQQDSIQSVYRDARDVRITNAIAVPELTAQLRKLYEPMSRFFASFDSYDSSIRADQQAMVIESTYSADGGRWQQLDAFNLFSYVAQVASAWGGSDLTTAWDMRDAVALRAPEGKLDAQMPVLLAIVNSLRETPEYSRQLLELQTKISQGNHEAAMQTIATYAEISRSSYNANQQINAGIMKSYNERNASLDRGQRDFVNYIHDQQDYSDPSVSGNVTLPAAYDRVFSNGKGDYVLTNDASFEPGADWSSINRAR